jgi:hypothetical protein
VTDTDCPLCGGIVRGDRGPLALLDVDRLARALHRSYDRDPTVRRIEWRDLNEAERGMWRRHAAAIAREYEEGGPHR